MTYVTNESGLCAWTFEIEPTNRNFYDHVIAWSWEAVYGKDGKAQHAAEQGLRELFDKFWFAGRNNFHGTVRECTYLAAMLPQYGSTNHTVRWGDLAEMILKERDKRIRAGTIKEPEAPKRTGLPGVIDRLLTTLR